ncbi:type IV toxin-antitoxin system AbiEi family antitoxin domain-containing protein [Jiangella muralis]|uniref:type IV toxin-antitoxin system AbiEi family antitoxin domain-containing protein n=1 Tax=Jiangella muralis TaxID=702383 RepID=UPI0012F9DF39|nr:type IV toxin-antitoxin system AbiEi family antitoxin domain-containing protein [Jiangella muralis]
MAQMRAENLARLQDGLITRGQALAAGLTPSAIEHALRRGGPWQRVVRGVYATFTGPLAPLHRLRAACLRVGDGALVTGAWACWMSGLKYGPPTGAVVDMLVARKMDRSDTGFVRVHQTSRLPQMQFWINRDETAGALPVPPDLVLDSIAPTARPGVIPTVPAARAVIDAVVLGTLQPSEWTPAHRGAGLRNVRALMCEVVQRRKSSLAELRVEARAARRRGSALIRVALADIEAGCRSAPECELRDVVRHSRILPEPHWNRPLPGVRGIVPDACWDEQRLVVEVDSRSFHGFGDAPERTEHRRARLAALGWVVLPVSPARLRADPAGVQLQIEAAYIMGRGRPCSRGSRA